MNDPYTRPGEVIRLTPADDRPADPTRTLLDTGRLKITRAHLDTGQHDGTYQARGQTLFVCLSGELVLQTPDGDAIFGPGEMTWVADDQPHELTARRESQVAIFNLPEVSVTGASADAVQESSQESFPASDPPSWT